MEKTAVKLARLRIKAFTLLESLLALFVVSFILLGLSGSVQAGFNQVQEQLFFMEFEHLYQESQKLSLAGHEKIVRFPMATSRWNFPRPCRSMLLRPFSLIRLAGILRSARLFFKRRIKGLFISFIWAMENLKRRRMKASILLEALVAMAVFAAIASLLLGQISQSRQEQTRLLQEEEVLRVARMAMQTGQENLTVNGITVRQVKTDQQLTVYHQEEKVLSVKKR